MKLACLLMSPGYRVGDPRPEPYTYLAWHEWAEVQHKGGLRQSVCTKCSLWRYPQEVCCGAPRMTAREDAAGSRRITKELKHLYPSQEDRYKAALKKIRATMKKMTALEEKKCPE